MYYMISDQSLLKIGIVLFITTVILGIVMSEIKELFYVKIKIPYYKTGKEEEEIEKFYKENNLKR